MRVLQISSNLSSRGRGGAERFCLELSGWLQTAGVDIGLAGGFEGVFAESSQSWPLREERRKLIRKLVFDYVSPGNASRLHKILASFQPDLVHVHNVYGIASQLIRVAAEHAPTVITVHDYWPVDVFVPRLTHGRLQYPRRQQLLLPWVWAHRAIHRRYLRDATLVSPSRYLARRLERFGYRDVRVIPNGITLPSETTAGDDSILFVGRLVPEKGLQEVLSSVEEVAQEFGWRIDVVGEGPLRAGLEQAFPMVRFHGWADPAPFYRKAGIVLVPSLWPENFGYAVVEAMGYGLPVLASNVGGIPEIVDNGITGQLYDPDASEQLISALRALAGDATLRQRLGRAARERVERKFTWASTGPRYLALYEELARVPARSVDSVPVS
jgi:glycosyltransferase involved in cell wall biosynthesis